MIMEKKEAMKILKDFHDKSALFSVRTALDTVFPEFVELEDEKMRKHIIEVLKDNFSGEDTDRCIAWLEKQGEQKPAEWHREDEQNLNVCLGYIPDEFLRRWLTDVIHTKYDKPTDKVEPKFKKGDWVIDKQGIVHQISNVIENVTNHTYGYDIVGGGYFNDNTEGVRLWTIQDAKDGDVLARESGWTCIFKKLVNDETFSSYCFLDNTKWFCETGSECHTLKEEFVKAYNGKIYPATKEQRDTLMKAMTDAGYTFDFEKKELKKIEQKPILDIEIPFGTDSELVEEAITIPDGCYAIIEDNKVILRKGEKKSSWSEEDKGAKSLRPQNRCTYNPYKEVVESIAEMCEKYEDANLDSLKDFYSNVKVKCKDAKEYDSLFPQSTWKPSREQMNTLFDVIVFVEGYHSNFKSSGKVLEKLYNDLKKLREE